MTQDIQTPQEALRRKRLRLADDAGDDTAPAVDGLIGWHPLADRRIEVTYDVRRIALDGVVEALRDGAVPVAGDRRARWAVAWQSYLDRNARANLTQADSPCCSNPTAVYASRKRR